MYRNELLQARRSNFEPEVQLIECREREGPEPDLCETIRASTRGGL